jgi:sec-independent protein translocase protein TatC
MSLSKYIIEVKNRIFLLCITGLSSFLTCYFYKETLLFVFVQPQVLTSINSDLNVFYFIFTDVTEIFSVYVKLVTFLTIQIILLYLLYHSFVFLSSALYRTEYSYFNSVLIVSLSIWCFSIILLTQILIPLTWNFFLSFQYITAVKSVHIHFEAKLNEYLSFYVSVYYLCIFYCQIFTGLFFSLKYINADIQVIRKFRKLYYYLFVVFSTLVSPPDILSQFLISVVVIFMYEFLVFTFIFRASVYSLVR